MKKTLTVNLGGTVFHIDEDAYQLLDKYLSNLRIHFLKEEGAEEIMADFEMRISELLNERIRGDYARTSGTGHQTDGQTGRNFRRRGEAKCRRRKQNHIGD